MSEKTYEQFLEPLQLVDFNQLKDRQPSHAVIENTDLVITKLLKNTRAQLK